MNRPDVIKKIQTNAAVIFSIDETQITESLSNKDIESWDSLAQLRLFMALEEEFSVKFDVGEITRTLSIKAIADLIMEKTT